MRNLFVTLITVILFIAVTSCERMFGNFLEKAPGVDVTEDTIFSSKAQVMIFLAACYDQGLQDPWAIHNFRFGSSQYGGHSRMALVKAMCASDEAKHRATWWQSNLINDGSLSIDQVEWQATDWINEERFTAIRMIGTMLERIDAVPDADDAFKTRIKAEVRFLRAQIYFDMFRLYGGVNIVKKRFSPDQLDAMRVPRSSIDSTIQWIIQDCDFARDNLSDSYSSLEKGRVTKGTALALKAKTLLYAASPLFNTATPYLSMANPANNRLICYGNYDVNRWQKAADAAKAVLDWAPAAGVSLVEDQGVEKNYRYVWEKQDNQEIIFAGKHANGEGSPYTYYLPNFIGSQGPCPTQNFIESFYDKMDGTPQTWPTTGTDLNVKYAELDPRFRQTIAYNGSYFNPQRGNLALYIAPPAPAGVHSNLCLGYWLKKHVPDAVNSTGSTYPLNWTWYRLAEFYLSYAEALNEAQGPVQAAYDAVNRIRARSGMPKLPTGLTQDQFRQRVRKEWGVEFAYDHHRWYDLLRWRTAENVLNGPYYGLNIYYPNRTLPITAPNAFSYQKYVFENRVWQMRFYLCNYPIDEVNKGYLVQNPGW